MGDLRLGLEVAAKLVLEAVKLLAGDPDVAPKAPARLALEP
jgi:hypothetical protein